MSAEHRANLLALYEKLQADNERLQMAYESILFTCNGYEKILIEANGIMAAQNAELARLRMENMANNHRPQ